MIPGIIFLLIVMVSFFLAIKIIKDYTL
jgi:hypothetical protein